MCVIYTHVLAVSISRNMVQGLWAPGVSTKIFLQSQPCKIWVLGDLLSLETKCWFSITVHRCCVWHHIFYPLTPNSGLYISGWVWLSIKIQYNVISATSSTRSKQGNWHFYRCCWLQNHLQFHFPLTVNCMLGIALLKDMCIGI